ncbi:MAG: aminotransferase class V-fold PLP-dependent enzyme, partial [Bacteroidales bacterium]|nr:aminotransferase class V-fold PLP-dependent enzyme [Bacteroidales bacterium]
GQNSDLLFFVFNHFNLCMKRNVYLDNSATSWPKPPQVMQEMSNYLENYGGSPGRSGHHFALEAGRQIFEARELIRDFFNAPASERVIFTANSTHAINMALKGLLKENDHVVVSSMEHNSVIRPLRYLEKERKISITVVEYPSNGEFPAEKLENAICDNTKLVCLLHGSNVLGSVIPLNIAGEICKRKNVLFMVDAAQTAGFVPIDMQKDNIDILSFTGHKKLYGPSGTGGLCFGENVEIEPVFQGGSGSKSESELHPDFYPDKLEGGTKNTLGIIGLKAGMQYIQKKGMNVIREHCLRLRQAFIDGLSEIEETEVFLPSTKEVLPVVSLNFKNHISSDIAEKLDRDFGIMIRVGLHCSPLAHKTIGTFPHGTARFSFGCFNTLDEVNYAINAIKVVLKNEKS